jgi:hypothetical protein
LQFKVQIEAIHNKDYSVVKTFKAATSVVAFFFAKKTKLFKQIYFGILTIYRNFAKILK